MRINQNIMALNAYRNLSANSASMAKSLEKLSSGTRINRAGDDAAGLVISQGLRAQVGGLRQAARNAQDGISVVQTAEGALNEVHTMLGRMRDLAVQSANSGSSDQKARDAANAEVTELKAEIDRIAGTTKFGNTSLLNGSYGVTAAKVTGFDADNSYTFAAASAFTINVNGTGAVTANIGAGAGVTGTVAASTIQTAIRSALAAGSTAQQAFADKVSVESQTVGAGSSLTVKVDGLTNGQTFVLTDGANTPLAAGGFSSLSVTAASGTGGVFQVGANASETIGLTIGNMDAATLGVNAVDLSTAGGASSAITSIDTAIANVSSTRGNLGAKQNRFESVISNLQVATENLSSSESRIRDTDYAMEMVQFTRGQILNQAATSMLGQANQLPQGVLSLLRG